MTERVDIRLVQVVLTRDTFRPGGRQNPSTHYTVPALRHEAADGSVLWIRATRHAPRALVWHINSRSVAHMGGVEERLDSSCLLPLLQIPPPRGVSGKRSRASRAEVGRI